METDVPSPATSTMEGVIIYVNAIKKASKLVIMSKMMIGT